MGIQKTKFSLNHISLDKKDKEIMRRADEIIVGFQASPPKLQTKRRVEEFNTTNHHRIDCET